MSEELNIPGNSRYIVMSRRASMPAKCMGGSSYRRVAVVEVDTDILHEMARHEPAAIDVRSVGVVGVVETWERLFAGSTRACAYERARDKAEDLADDLNRAWYSKHPDLVESDEARSM